MCVFPIFSHSLLGGFTGYSLQWLAAPLLTVLLRKRHFAWHFSFLGPTKRLSGFIYYVYFASRLLEAIFFVVRLRFIDTALVYHICANKKNEVKVEELLVFH